MKWSPDVMRFMRWWNWMIADWQHLSWTRKKSLCFACLSMAFSFLYNNQKYHGECVRDTNFGQSFVQGSISCSPEIKVSLTGWHGACHGAVISIKEEEEARRAAEEEMAVLACRWKSLPHDLQVDILRHLPLTSVFRLRLVCNAWNAMLRSTTVMEHIGDSIEMDRDVTEFWFYL